MSTHRIALNGRFSGTLQPTGTQVAAFHLLDAIIRAPRECELVVFADPLFSGVSSWAGIPQTELIPVPFSKWRRSTAQLWEQFVLPGRARRVGCPVIHHPMTTCPRWSCGLKNLVTVHDLHFYHYPQWVSRGFRAWLMATAIPGIRKADYVATISDYVLADVRKTLLVPESRSSRIYNGVKRSVLANSAASEPSGRRSIFMLNAWQPHKNLARVLEAFTLLRRDYPQLELRLGGRPQAHFREQSGLREKLDQPGVSILGYLSEADLLREYQTAAVFCYPSLEEGFGLPILEAMDAGVVVVTSNVSCLPEIAGDSGVLVDPYSVNEIAAGLRKALNLSGVEWCERVEKGRKQVSRFSWQESAREYVKLYSRFF